MLYHPQTYTIPQRLLRQTHLSLSLSIGISEMTMPRRKVRDFRPNEIRRFTESLSASSLLMQQDQNRRRLRRRRLSFEEGPDKTSLSHISEHRRGEATSHPLTLAHLAERGPPRIYIHTYTLASARPGHM